MASRASISVRTCIGGSFPPDELLLPTTNSCIGLSSGWFALALLFNSNNSDSNLGVRILCRIASYVLIPSLSLC